MRLVKLKYNQFKDTEQEWLLNDCDFDKFNLFVGKNSSGKSKTLNIIYNLAQAIAGKRNYLHQSNFEFTFENDGHEIKYSVIKSDSAIESEIFELDRKVLLQRNADGTGKIWAEKINTELDFQISVYVYGITAKRDKLQHNFLEPLIQWAEEVSIFRFGTELGQNNLLIENSNSSQKINPLPSDLHSPTFIPSQYFYIGIKEYSDNFIDILVDDMREIGFPINNIELTSPTKIKITQPIGELKCIVFNEDNLKSKIDQFDISQGMFRAFSLLVYINYLKLKEVKSTILIDDIGEGMDHERSKKLIQRIVEISKSSKFQVIMTSNDRYVMNAIDIKNWSIVVRDGHEIRFVNYKNSKGQFDDFTQLGLSNFDFFSGNFFK
jgi:energy-coupling factor transporter ATP-binding protein EcfA2